MKKKKKDVKMTKKEITSIVLACLIMLLFIIAGLLSVYLVIEINVTFTRYIVENKSIKGYFGTMFNTYQVIIFADLIACTMLNIIYRWFRYLNRDDFTEEG